MSEITHEEAQKCIVELTSDKELNEIEIGDLQNKLRVYFAQQEKVNELLELYQKKDKIGRKYGEDYDYADIWNEIDKLERELNDNK
jgi:hypothetical protein